MRRRKKTRDFAPEPERSGLFSWFGRSRKLDRLEERDWRRRIVLASRKLQLVQRTLSADVSDVRGLRKDLDRTRPDMDRLEQELGESRSAAGSLERKLDEHAALLRAALERHQRVDPNPYEAQLRELEAQLEGVQAQLAEAHEHYAQQLAALRAEKGIAADGSSAGARLRAELETHLRKSEERRAMQAAHHAEEVQNLGRVSEARIHELETELAHVRQELAAAEGPSKAEKRVAELELQLRGLHSLRADYEHSESEVARLRYEHGQRVNQLEGRIDAAENEKARMAVRHEQALSEIRAASEERLREIEASARAAEESRAKLEQELAALREERASRDAAEDAKLEQATARFEAQIAELEERIRILDAEREEVCKDHGRELADSAARILELEAFAAELSQTKRELEKRIAEGERLTAQLRARVDELERERQELGEDFAREASLLESSHQAELKRLEADLAELRLEREKQTKQHALAVARANDSSDRTITELQRRLREAEKSRIEVETMHVTSMTDFADHTRARIVRLEARIAEKEEGIRELIEKVRQKDSAIETVYSVLEEREREIGQLKKQLVDQESANARLEASSSELKRLQDELEFSGQKLEEQTGRLLDLMQNVDAEDWLS